MNVYINIEIEKRELLSKILLSLESASKGNTVYLGKIVDLLLKGYFKPGIVLQKSLTPGIERINELNFFENKYFTVTSLDEEHGLLNQNNQYTKTRFSEETLRLSYKVFCWGSCDYARLVKIYPQFKNKFINSGNPRLDFWRKDFKSFFNGKSNKKKYILISSNFDSVSYNSITEMIKFHEKTGYFKRGLNKNLFKKKLYDSKKMFQRYVKTIKTLSNKFTEEMFVIRPHPKNDPKKIRDLFKNHKNIEVINYGLTSDLISQAKLVIHAGCTVGLESSIRNVPTFAYYPQKLKHGNEIANSFSKKIYKEKKLIENIYKIKNKKYAIEEKFKNNLINNRASNLQKNKSYKIITDEWQKIKKKYTIKMSNNDLWLRIYFFLKDLRIFLLNKEYGNHKFSKFNKEEVKNIVERLCKVDKKFSQIKFYFLKNDIIKFYK